MIEALLRRLVGADSSNPPGDERQVAAIIEDAARQLGLPKPRRYGCADRRPNLIYELGTGSPTLLIGAHMDTVPPGDIAEWTHDPLTLARDESRYRGLGVADMKGAIAALLVSAPDLRSTGRIVLAFTADEESSCEFGMAWLCREGLIEADAAVLLEPASSTDESWDGLYIAERGSCVVRLTASGEPGHSGQPLPAEARAGAPFIAALAALASKNLFPDFKHPLDATPPVVNLPTMVSGGITPWQHPHQFEAVLEIRTVPGMSREHVQRVISDILEAHGLAKRVTVAIESWGEPPATTTDERLVAACTHALSRVTGRMPRPAVFPAATDAAHLAGAGIPTVSALGPGTLKAIHQPDEWLPSADLPKTVHLLRHLVTAYRR